MNKESFSKGIKFLRIISYVILIILICLRVYNEFQGITSNISMETMIFAVVIVVLFSLIEE